MDSRPKPAPVPLLVSLLTALALGGCADEPAAVEVAGMGYTIGYTADELLGLPAERRLVLGELAGLGRAIAAGEASSLADPLVERRGLEHLARVHAALEALDSAGVGDDVLRARYLTDPAVELTVRHLLIFSERWESEQTRGAAREKAERALERIRGGEPFPDVAADVSEEPGAEGREGLLQPGREGAWVPEFWAAARALEPGEISAVTETQYGFHVLRLEDRDTVPFDEVRPRVALDVARLMRVDTEPEGVLQGLDVTVEPGARAALASFDAFSDTGTDGTGGETGSDGGASEETTEEAGAAAASEAAAVTWADGGLGVGDLRRWLATLPAARLAEVLDDPSALEDEARRAARLHEAANRARAAGAAVPAGVEAEARREWEDQLAVWTHHFGFAESMSDEALRSAALAALGATGQGPSNARDALHVRGPLVRLRYPVTVRSPAEGGR